MDERTELNPQMKSLILVLVLGLGCNRSDQVRKEPDLVKRQKANSIGIGLALESFRISNGSYPDSLDELTQYDSDFSFSDVWGTPVKYTLSGDTFTVQSAGADREFKTVDDVVISRDDLGVDDDET
jgi:hypothetical protein